MRISDWSSDVCSSDLWHPDVAGEMRHGSMGRAMPGWTATVLKDDADEIAAPGELGRVVIDLANSPLMWFTGYVDAPEKTAERFSPDGRWYYNGDAGPIDEDGYLFRSEEHTSDLQSLMRISYAVFCLKKKNT